MDAMTRSRTSGIDRSLQILDVLTEQNRPMTAYELSKETGAPVSTVYRLVDELVGRDMLTRREEGTIWLGPRLMRYGLSYRASIDVYAEARREMRRLAEATGETVQLCARDGLMMAVIAMVEGQGHFRITSDVGTRVPLNWTASVAAAGASERCRAAGHLCRGCASVGHRHRRNRPRETGRAVAPRLRGPAGDPGRAVGIRGGLHRRARARRTGRLCRNHFHRAGRASGGTARRRTGAGRA